MNWRWWYWWVASAVWCIATFAILIGVIQPGIESHDLRILVGLLGGLVLGWVGGRLLIIGWFSR